MQPPPPLLSPRIAIVISSPMPSFAGVAIKSDPFENDVGQYLVFKIHTVKRTRKRSDSVLWQKPLHPQKNSKSNVTTHKRHQKLRLHNDCGPTKDGQLG